MKISMLIPFLVAAVSSHSQFMSGLMFRDPRAFVATFADADPSAINKVIEMVNSMIDVGLAEKQKAIDDHAASVIVAADAGTALAAAQKDLIFKKGELHIATDIADDLGAIDDLKNSEESAALAALNAADAAVGVSQSHLDAETARIDGEKATLEEVLEILEGLSGEEEEPPARRLLSYSPAAFLATLAKQGLTVDPDALASVIGSVNDLIAEGEALREAATTALADATAHQAAMKKEYDESIDAHVASSDKLAAALAEKGMYQNIVDEATGVHNDATKAKNEADANEAALEAFRVSEIARVDSETADLDNVKNLLKNLL